MSDYICPQCGQTYDMAGICNDCGVDLQPNDVDIRDKESKEEGLNDADSDTYDDLEDDESDISGSGSVDDFDNESDEYDDE